MRGNDDRLQAGMFSYVALTGFRPTIRSGQSGS
jgi:hypothetical protein